jgi:hypothetical protein
MRILTMLFIIMLTFQLVGALSINLEIPKSFKLNQQVSSFNADQ